VSGDEKLVTNNLDDQNSFSSIRRVPGL